ncbi:MAG TPA: sulfate adenylyltransferase subunit CysN [Holophagaceae bacterium]|nr:sulfate adenylyltransferase subunit CysN [Holophagaceae bacterium]
MPPQAPAPEKPLLRFITCGSVDDGKSTLIGRLLHESKCLFEDQLDALARDSKQFGTQGEAIDFALLVDGLQAEREQGITIDVAYRFFASAARRFIVADTPGHEQYTRNMATGASTADLAILLVDARKGLLTQTRRHARIAGMMGIRHAVLAVNKMDLMGCDQGVFDAIVEAFRPVAEEQGFRTLQAIPLSALEGDNVVAPSARMPWYAGPTLMAHLEAIDAAPEAGGGAFRMPVQWVNRPNLDFRGFCGRVAQGEIRPGDPVRILPSGVSTRVKAVLAWEGGLDRAGQGDSITLTLADEVDVSRGDLIAADQDPAPVSDQFEAQLLWMSEQPLVPGRPYLLKLHAQEVTATVTAIKHRVDADTGARLAARTLQLNEIGRVNLSLSRPVPFEPYATNRILGGFILIDKLTFDTAGAGMIDFALRRATNIHWQALEVDRAARARLMGQRPRCVWFTGLSGSGKSTLANLLEKRLHAEGRHTFVLDGDNVRHGLNRDLGFAEADRVENIRRVAEVAKLMTDAGLLVLVSFISPFRSERQMARELFGPGDFLEVFVDAPLDACERRDVKGLYAKARRGELRNFTGIDSPYEPPEHPELHLRTATEDPEACLARLVALLETP